MNIGEGLSRSEREFVIRKCDTDNVWNVWTSSPVWARRLGRIADRYGIQAEKQQGGISWRFPLNFITFRRIFKFAALEDDSRSELDKIAS